MLKSVTELGLMFVLQKQGNPEYYLTFCFGNEISIRSDQIRSDLHDKKGLQVHKRVQKTATKCTKLGLF